MWVLTISLEIWAKKPKTKTSDILKQGIIKSPGEQNMQVGTYNVLKALGGKSQKQKQVIS